MTLSLMKEAEAKFTTAIRTALGRIPFRDLNEPLYHFTDSVGLDGILRTRSLWASLATSLEDSSEIEYALSRARKVLEQGNLTGDPCFLRLVVPFLDPQKSETIHTLGMKTYIVCFRTGVDEHAHWQRYGRFGTGCAIAFGLKALVIPGILAFPVLYDPTSQDALLRVYIEDSAQLFHDLAKRCTTTLELARLRGRAIQWTVLGIWVLAPAMKAPSFAGESEWRIIVTDMENVAVEYGDGMSREVKIRQVGSRTIPYKVLKYEKLPIAQLQLGTDCPIREDDLDLKRRLSEAVGGFDVPIVRSGVSLIDTG